jgi:hypothetical protein
MTLSTSTRVSRERLGKSSPRLEGLEGNTMDHKLS